MKNEETEIKMEPPASPLTPVPTPPPSAERKYLFTREIQLMMHGLGDSAGSLLESAQVIEQILTHQLHLMYFSLEEIAVLRGSKTIGFEDILFLMRKNKVKLQRLMYYLTVKHLRAHMFKPETAAPEIVVPSQSYIITRCHEFLTSLYKPGEFRQLLDNPLPDPVRQKRLLRCDYMSKAVDSKRYEKFTEARSASFIARATMVKFKDWINDDIFVDMKPNIHAMDILAILSKEIVAVLVDLALTVRRDVNAASSTQPFSKAMYPVIETYSGAEKLSYYSSFESGTPTTLFSDKSTPFEGQKKVDDHLALINPALKPSEIREGYRRFLTQNNPLAPFSFNMQEVPLENQILCL